MLSHKFLCFYVVFHLAMSIYLGSTLIAEYSVSYDHRLELMS